ncbi:MAG: hypothetical protein QXR12_02750 [Thermofilum sp.]
MTRKKRFGVSLDKETFELLDGVAKGLGIDRSRLIALATREYLAGQLHFTRPHECDGVLILSYSSSDKSEVDELLESSGPLIVSRSHLHTKAGCCVEMLYVRGPSDSIWNLHASANKVCKECRYVPVCL